MQHKKKNPRPKKPQQKKAGRGILNSARLDFTGTPYAHKDQLEEPQNTWLTKYSKDDTYHYVNFFDSEDSFTKLMHSVINSSPTQKSILQKKRFFTIGKGFLPVSKKNSVLISETETTNPNSAHVEDISEFVNEINAKGENIQDLLEKAIWDYDSFGNLYIEIIKTSEGIQAYHRPFNEVRLKEVLNRVEDTQYCVVSRDFGGVLGTNYDRQILPLYPTFEKIDGFERSILHVKNYQSGFDYYGLPSWISAILWAELEYRIPKYNQSEFENGFMPSALVQMFGTENDEQAQDALDMFDQEQTGTGNHAKMFAMLLQEGTSPAKIDLLMKQHEGSYLELSELARTNIMLANNFSDALLGIKTAGELGGSQNLRTELEYKYEEMFIPRQRFFSRKVIQPLLDLWGEQRGYKQDVSLKFTKNLPVSFVGDIDISAVMTVNEKREIAGLPPLDNNQITPE